MNEIQELQEQWTKTMKEAEEIRLKYQGKVKDMPGDEVERWEKAINDADDIARRIEVAKKEARLRETVKKTEDLLPFVKGNGHQVPDDQRAALKDWGQMIALKMPKEDYRAKVVDKGLTAASAPGGGYFVVPKVVANEIIRLVEDEVFIRQYARKETLTQAESLGVLTMNDIDDFDWTSELASGNEDANEPFGEREISPKPMAKRLKISKKLLRLSSQPEAEMMRRIVYVKSRTEEKAFLTGSGANRPLGIMTESNNGVSTSRNVATATANTVKPDDFISAVSALKGAYRMGARWIIHRNTEGRVRLSKDSQNNYLWSPFGGVGQGVGGGMPATIVGFPYDVSEFMADPAISGNITTGTFVAALCNYERGYQIVDALNMEVQVLYELYSTSNQQGYVFRAETDAAPIDENAFVRIKVS